MLIHFLPLFSIFSIAQISLILTPHSLDYWLCPMGPMKGTGFLPSSQGAQDSMMPSLADLRIDSGSGMECRTIAP